MRVPPVQRYLSSPLFFSLSLSLSLSHLLARFLVRALLPSSSRLCAHSLLLYFLAAISKATSKARIILWLQHAIENLVMSAAVADRLKI